MVGVRMFGVEWRRSVAVAQLTSTGKFERSSSSVKKINWSFDDLEDAK